MLYIPIKIKRWIKTNSKDELKTKLSDGFKPSSKDEFQSKSKY
jgi:hypothetical protein